MTARATMLLRKNIVRGQLNPRKATPRAVPDAGGCSVSVAAIRNVAIPTDKAPSKAKGKAIGY